MSDYAAFLDAKAQHGTGTGFAPAELPAFLFDFQRALVEWSLRQGRSAIFADCGLGKTPMQLAWAQSVYERTGRPVLIITPLAVGAQTILEGQKFGIEVAASRDGRPAAGLTVTNYERLHHFDPTEYGACVADESSAIKSFDGKHRTLVTEFMRRMEYRLLCTATAAPNDYIELGTSSEALGYLGHLDMLGRFFKNDQNSIRTNRNWSVSKWRFKGHAEDGFWKWVSSWARAMRRPSDLGFDDARFVLPALSESESIVQAKFLPDGCLFERPAIGLWEEREEQRRTLTERCERTAELVLASPEPCVSWCHMNPEGDLLEKLISGSVQVSGSDSPEAKEEALIGFGRGDFKYLVIKPKIGAWGLNWQHCNRMTFFPSHSFEQYYQAVRRCWRFGQKRPVSVHIVTTESGQGVMKNLQRKADQADTMFSSLVRHMNDAIQIDRTERFPVQTEVPSWL